MEKVGKTKKSITNETLLQKYVYDFKKRTSGITLIALIVTIIVLLILAGVTIATLTGDNGILSQVQNASTTTKIAEIEEQANLIYTAELIKRLSGQTSTELDLAVVCTELQDKTKYNYDIQLKTTDAPTITGILINPTTIIIAQGDDTKSIEATPVVTEATGSWYAFVDGKYYRIYILEGKKQVKIDRTSTDVNGEGVTEQVTFTSNNNEVVFKATETTTATVNCNAEGKATAIIAVGEEATDLATITASIGGKTAECEVTVLKNVTVSTQVVNTSDSENVGTATEITNALYAEGSTIELTAAVTNTDYQFVGWYEIKDGGTETSTPISTNASCIYEVPNDGTTTVVIKAKFAKKPQTLGTTANDSGVGYYINKGTAQNPEYAIVFADRVAQASTAEKTNTVTWSSSNTSSCTFPTLTGNENFKTYVISDEEYTDPMTVNDSRKGFGTHKVIKVANDNTGTEDRFMAMALSDVDINTHCWYDSAMDDDRYAIVTETGFNTGKTNTQTMITKWNDTDFGSKNGSSSYPDVWGIVQTKFNQGWFVPSKDEWSAFAAYLKDNKGLTKDNYSDTFGLNRGYWTSSQYALNTNRHVWNAYFRNGLCGTNTTNIANSVRLATTF